MAEYRATLSNTYKHNCIGSIWGAVKILPQENLHISITAPSNCHFKTLPLVEKDNLNHIKHGIKRKLNEYSISEKQYDHFTIPFSANNFIVKKVDKRLLQHMQNKSTRIGSCSNNRNITNVQDLSKVYNFSNSLQRVDIPKQFINDNASFSSNSSKKTKSEHCSIEDKITARPDEMFDDAERIQYCKKALFCFENKVTSRLVKFENKYIQKLKMLEKGLFDLSEKYRNIELNQYNKNKSCKFVLKKKNVYNKHMFRWNKMPVDYESFSLKKPEKYAVNDVSCQFSSDVSDIKIVEPVEFYPCDHLKLGGKELVESSVQTDSLSEHKIAIHDINDQANIRIETPRENTKCPLTKENYVSVGSCNTNDTSSAICNGNLSIDEDIGNLYHSSVDSSYQKMSLSETEKSVVTKDSSFSTNIDTDNEEESDLLIIDLKKSNIGKSPLTDSFKSIIKDNAEIKKSAGPYFSSTKDNTESKLLLENSFESLNCNVSNETVAVERDVDDGESNENLSFKESNNSEKRISPKQSGIPTEKVNLQLNNLDNAVNDGEDADTQLCNACSNSLPVDKDCGAKHKIDAAYLNSKLPDKEVANSVSKENQAKVILNNSLITIIETDNGLNKSLDHSEICSDIEQFGPINNTESKSNNNGCLYKMLPTKVLDEQSNKELSPKANKGCILKAISVSTADTVLDNCDLAEVVSSSLKVIPEELGETNELEVSVSMSQLNLPVEKDLQLILSPKDVPVTEKKSENDSYNHATYDDCDIADGSIESETNKCNNDCKIADNTIELEANDDVLKVNCTNSVSAVSGKNYSVEVTNSILKVIPEEQVEKDSRELQVSDSMSPLISSNKDDMLLILTPENASDTNRKCKIDNHNESISSNNDNSCEVDNNCAESSKNAISDSDKLAEEISNEKIGPQTPRRSKRRSLETSSPYVGTLRRSRRLSGLAEKLEVQNLNDVESTKNSPGFSSPEHSDGSDIVRRSLRKREKN